MALDFPTLDRTDVKLLHALRTAPRVGILDLARRVGIHRGTVQSRMERLTERGVVTGFGPEIDPKALGFGLLAFVTADAEQHQERKLLNAVRRIPEVVEVHAVAGPGDFLFRIVARDTAHLHAVLQALHQAPGILRTTTTLALQTPVPYRTDPLVASLVGD